MSALTQLIGPLPPQSRAADVVDRVTEAIHLGLLGDGEQLPVEVELARLFRVAPMTAREALAELRDQGLVETRRGRTGGSFVRRPAGPPVDFLRQRLAAMTLTELRDLVDEHRAVAGQAARLAAERAAQVNMRRLFALTDQLRTSSSLGDRIRADCRFHIEVSIASHSERLTRREVSLQAEVSGLLWLPLGPPVDVETVVAQHHAIATAVVSEDPEKARRLAEEHVDAELTRMLALRLQVDEDGGPADG
ncbi:FadR/GntR family transcriptional regulator [Nocardioides sp.]|uniref:FadR/GntR family transcriptional regulator n=1 Tax=Nocardioides sp. TaxID=35761 RepID=UPI003527B35B